MLALIGNFGVASGPAAVEAVHVPRRKTAQRCIVEHKHGPCDSIPNQAMPFASDAVCIVGLKREGGSTVFQIQLTSIEAKANDLLPSQCGNLYLRGNTIHTHTHTHTQYTHTL